jgi:hypothetical protein
MLISMVTQLHAASCKLQVASVQRSMNTVMTKFQLDLHFVFADPTLFQYTGMYATQEGAAR